MRRSVVPPKKTKLKIQVPIAVLRIKHVRII